MGAFKWHGTNWTENRTFVTLVCISCVPTDVRQFSHRCSPTHLFVDLASAAISPLLQQQLHVDINRNETVCSSIAFHYSFIRIRYWKRTLKVTVLHKVIDLLTMYTSNREWLLTIRLLGFFAENIIPRWHKWIRKLIIKYSIMYFLLQ